MNEEEGREKAHCSTGRSWIYQLADRRTSAPAWLGIDTHHNNRSQPRATTLPPLMLPSAANVTPGDDRNRFGPTPCSCALLSCSPRRRRPYEWTSSGTTDSPPAARSASQPARHSGPVEANGKDEAGVRARNSMPWHAAGSNAAISDIQQQQQPLVTVRLRFDAMTLQKRNY